MINLVDAGERDKVDKNDIALQLEKLYWRQGATELASGKKTLTLRQFEEKYMKVFLETGLKFRQRNLRWMHLNHFSGSHEIETRLKEYDQLANVMWPLAHLRSAGRYLQKDPEDIKATGGTNWQKYLPPRFQRVIFFPELWTDQEKSEWGKRALMGAVQL